MTTFAPREVLTSAKLNAALGEKANVSALAGKADIAALAGKADLDSTGVLRADQIPTSITTGIAAAQADATAAKGTADQAQQDATAAGQAAAAAQGTADGAVQGIAQAREDAAEALELATTARSDASAAKADAAAALSSRIPTAHRGIANGVAALDGTGRVPLSQLPDGIGSGGGTSYSSYSSDLDFLFVPPKANMFTWVNGSNNTKVTDTTRGMEVVLEGAGTQNLRTLVRPKPGAKWRVTACIEHPALINLYVSAGLACRSSVSTRVEHPTWINQWNELQNIFHRLLLTLRWNTSIQVDSTLTTRGIFGGHRLFQRMSDDGVTRRHEVCADGKSWMEVASSPSGEFLTVDQVGLGFSAIVGNRYNSLTPYLVTHWAEEVLP
ncbi:MAG: hypothetical protein DI601_00275 [Azospirillum brasilense]|nr:MAG: hypothetical protein DI601_00275 [Azospirillum brasilense]